MKPIILPELIDKGDSIEGIPWRQLFIWGEPRKSGIGTWDGQRHAGWVYPLRLPVYPEVFRNSIPGKMEGASHAAVLSKSFVKRLPPYAHGTVGYCTPCSLHMMRSSFVSIKRRRPHMSRALCWRTFSASLVISGALPATEGTPVGLLPLHPFRYYDWSKFVLICVDSHVIEGSGIDEQKISQRLFSVAICLLPVWFLSINTFE